VYRTLKVVVSLIAFLGAIPAQASLFRAYLSVAGSDANPCTVQFPCRLLPAALNAVADGGEIWILDSANYNTSTVTINKSVAIVALPGVLGSVVANGSDAISINALTSKVVLRNLNVRQLAGTGPNNGLVILAAQHVSLDNCVFEKLSTGIFLNGNATVDIKDSVIRSSTVGMSLQQANGGTDVVSIDRTSLLDNVVSIAALANSTTGSLRVTIDHGVIEGTGNFGNGAVSFGGGVSGAAPVSASIARTKIAGRGAGTGVNSFGSQTVVSLADCHVSGFGTGAGLLNGVTGVGVLRSLQNNFFVDNGVDFAFTPGAIAPQ
jgi:hypothetical protein